MNATDSKAKASATGEEVLAFAGTTIAAAQDAIAEGCAKW